MNEKEIISRFKEAQDSLVIQQSDFSLSVIFQMVNENAVDIKPHYQRRDRWSIEKQSALIESFLLNVPVPPVYFSEDDYGHYSVIDGKQRITAICDFLAGKLKLKGLRRFPELDGLYFKELPVPLQNALTVRPYIRVTTLLKQSNKSLKYEVFIRLNTGGELLKPQEIRNVAYSGQFNDLLFTLSENEFLRQQLKIENEKSSSFRSMDDVEHVLRFFTIKANWQKMGNVLADEMDRFMAQNQFATIVDISNFKIDFIRAISGCQQLWGNYAFQKPINNGWREQLISPLFDAQMVSVSMLTEDQINALTGNNRQVIQQTKNLFEQDMEFVKSVSQSTNNSSAVYRRVHTIYNMLISLV